VVVSPLIALMKDQVDALMGCGVPAAFVNSTQSRDERHEVADRIRAGELRLLYMAPERLLNDRTLGFLRESNVAFVAIDEAHCISEWGHDFRPEYRELKRLRRDLPGVALHAYTATATPRVRRDIARNLALDDPEILVGSFDRPNLTYKVEQRGDVIRQVRTVLERHKGESGIIYCIRRDDVDFTATMLADAGYRALPYHAGMDAASRKRNQDAFITEEADVIVATVAFGMGIDKPNVRFVLHTGMPKSLENYQQESGRAGRDGLEAECCLFYSGGDFHTWKRMLSDLEGEAHRAATASLSRIYDYCTSVACRHRSLVQHFGEEYRQANCGACDVCLGEFDVVEDALIVGQKVLSCVIRLEERFGGEHTALVLAGSQEKKILERGHDQLSTWGLLKDEDRRTIRDWIEQLVGQRFLQKTGDYNTLQVTEAGWQVLRGEVVPRLLKPKAIPKKSRDRKRASKAAAESWEGVDEGLFEALRELRTQTARDRAVPGYVVFGDAALRDMARRRPVTPEAFLSVRGVGETKRDQFGEAFLACISSYCEEHALTTNVEPPEPSEEGPHDGPAIPPTPTKAALNSFAFFDDGKSVAEVCEATGRAVSTVNGYLNRYIRHRGITDPTRWVDVATVAEVERAISQADGDRLTPIFEALNGAVSYDEIRIVATCLSNRNDGAVE
ncbi:MAG: RecQ family ATP-dependent DNA helicase, partial [Planctomycetaceae bacterium]